MKGVGLAITARGTADHFVAALVQSLAEPLVAAGLGLYTRVVADDEAQERILRHWAKVDGVVGAALLGAGAEDPRCRLLRRLGLPFATVADAAGAGEAPGVVVDVAAGLDRVLELLGQVPHARTVYVVDPTPTLLPRPRAADLAGRVEVVSSDGSVASAVTVSRAALQAGPATLLLDSDVHAAAVLASLLEAGVDVPGTAAVVSWTDSSLCQSTTPSITAVNRRGADIGAALGAQLLAAVDGRAGAPVAAPHPFVVLRESA